MSQSDPLAGEYMVLPNGCWGWLGAMMAKGYGVLSYAGRHWRAHRLSYTLYVGPIPAGLELDHLCRNRACINPAHLEPVTRRENALRSPLNVAAVNARKTHCKRGHEFSPVNTWTDSRGFRHCRTCQRARMRARRAAKKEIK